MKRRIKIFSAIASLCLAVALMAFGVYAAIAVDYTVSGSVSYTVDDVLVHVNMKVEQLENSTKGYADVAVATGLTDEAATFGASPSWVAYNFASGNTTNVVDWYTYDQATGVKNANEHGSETLNLDFKTSTAYRITFTLTTVQKDTGVDVKVTLAETVGDNFTLVGAKADTEGVDATIDAATGTGVAENETPVTLMYYVYLNDTTKAIDAGASSYSIKLDMTQTQVGD